MILDRKNIVIQGTYINLSCEVASRVEKARAEKMAWSRPGVDKKENNISIAILETTIR